MSNLKAPSVDVSFIEKANSAVERGERGIVVVAIKETNPIEVTNVFSVADIPAGLTEENTNQIKSALVGYNNAPRRVIVYCMNAAEEATAEYKKMMSYLETIKWNWLAIPTVETDGKANDIASWIKSCRANKKLFKAVLPNTKADCEGVVNVTGKLSIDDTEYEAEKVCARVAGLIAGTSLTASCTYAPLLDYDNCDAHTDLDTPVGNGEFIFVNDGEKVKVVRGVTSFVTTTDGKGDSYKKIKLVEAMDMIADDIRQTAEDSYLGKYVNTYDNKCLLISAINAYFAGLITAGVLESGSCGIDIDAQRSYIESKGVSTEGMSDVDIKKYNTGAKVFLKANVVLLDAIEEIALPIYI